MTMGFLALKASILMARCMAFWEFFRKDGTLMRTGSFDLDRQVGIWKTYDREGKLVKETDFGD